MLTIDQFSLTINDRNIKNLSCSLFQCSISNIVGLDNHFRNVFLKSLAGFNKSFSGRILIKQNDIKESKQEYFNDIHYIDRTLHGFKEHLTVLDNLKHWAIIYGNELLIDTAFYFFELDDIADRKFITLNPSQKQSVILSRLILDPKPIWYLNEPFHYLNKSIHKKLSDMMKVRSNEGGIIIMNQPDQQLEIVNNKINLEDFRYVI
ncbi:ATP-binding cassette domain-containing protein [Rickettsiales bacterium]|nr:ATP-binding cassette domain-containing protein [Rickettsiales bacterium]